MLNLHRRDFLKQLGMLSAFATSPSFGFPSIFQANSNLFIDGLSFLPSDLTQLQSAGYTAGIFDVSNGENINGDFIRTFKACKKSIKKVLNDFKKNSEFLIHGIDSESIFQAHKDQKTAIFLQIQGGGEALDGNVDNLDFYVKSGLKVFQMTHHYNNPFAGGALVKNSSGLTEKGFALVEALNENKILIDLSHASDQTAKNVLEHSKRPVILSHGGCRHFVNNPRCAPDEVIKQIANSGGAMGIFMMSFWLTTDPEPTIDHYVQHIKHVVNIGGIESVAIANDFQLSGEKTSEGEDENDLLIKLYKNWWNQQAEKGNYGFEILPLHVVIPELNNIDRLFTIQTALLKNQFTAREVDLIMGKNWMRILNESFI